MLLLLFYWQWSSSGRSGRRLVALLAKSKEQKAVQGERRGKEGQEDAWGVLMALLHARLRAEDARTEDATLPSRSHRRKEEETKKKKKKGVGRYGQKAFRTEEEERKMKKEGRESTS